VNTSKAGPVIDAACAAIGATSWSPAQWGDRNSDAYAITTPGVAGVVMINTDTITQCDVQAYAYRAEAVPTRASHIMPALLADDGASLDPIAETVAQITGGDVAGALQRAITDAFGRI
jgi:hypothetical protein